MQKEVAYGVPQGSILGPLLFILYINDISYSSRGNFTLFADDTTISWAHNDIVALNSIIKVDIANVSNWFLTNKLSLNISKTKAMMFAPKDSPAHVNCSIEICNNKLEFVDHIKFLGITIDKNLTWNHHIVYINAKLAKTCYAIKVISHEINISVGRQVYFALFEPLLRYAIPFWGSANKTNLFSLFKIQKRAIRILNKSQKNASCKFLFITNKIMTLTNLYIFETSLLVFKNLSNIKKGKTFTTTTRVLHQISI